MSLLQNLDTVSQNKRSQKQRKGAMAVLVAITIILLLIAAAFSLDVAYMHVVRAELRTATDAAARAGAEALARTQDQAQATQAALDIAELNSVAGDRLTLDPVDVTFGGVTQNPTTGRFAFDDSATDLTTVQVNGRRDSSAPDGPVALFFGGVLGRSSFGPNETSTATASVRDIALVLDRSGSMSTEEDGLSRIDALKLAVQAFLDEIEISSPNARVSLVTYSDNATRDIELTDDFAAIVAAVNGLPADGYTNIREAIQFGSDSLQGTGRRPFADRTIVVMTDGNHNRPLNDSDPTPSANTAAGRGHMIHTVTFSSGANQTDMQGIANIGGGMHLHADDAADLTNVFRQIARSMSVLLIE